MINLETEIFKELSPSIKALMHQTYLLDLDVIADNKIIQCCVTKLFMTCDNEWIVYSPKCNYKNISHGYCPEAFDYMMKEIRAIPDMREK